MSTRETIFLTKDNEHCYYDVVDYVDDNGGVAILLEIEKKHAEVICDGDTDLIIRFTNPGSEIYKILESLKGKPKTIFTCQTCKHWQEHQDIPGQGRCNHGFFQNDDPETKQDPKDFAGIQAWSHEFYHREWIGKDFGCRYHQTKED